MLIEELHDAPAPADACARLLDLPFPLLLESAARGGSMGRYSYLTADPSQIWSTRPGDSPDALEQAAAYLAAHRAEPIRDLPPFQGGVAGFLGYEFGRRLERLPAPRADDLRLPDVTSWNSDASGCDLHQDVALDECWQVHLDDILSISIL